MLLPEVTIPKAFGQVLFEYRAREGYSQAKLALTAELDRSYVSLLERGQRQPTLTTLFKLAEVLNVAPATLVARTSALAR